MKEKRIFVLFILLAIAANLARGQENWTVIDEEVEGAWYAPDYFKIQYAGNIGFMSLGLGYNWWNDVAQSAFVYGYVPHGKGNATIHTFTVKNTFRLYQFNIGKKYNLSPTMGFSLSFEPGQNSYMRVPDKYPSGYYSPNSFYACINAGLKSTFMLKEERFFSNVEVYVEANTLADYVYYNIMAQEDRSKSVMSLSLGVNVFF